MRIFVVIVVLAVTTYIAYFSLGRLHEVLLRKPLAEIPGVIGQWNKTSQVYLDETIVNMLGVDEYVERFYVSPGRQDQHLDLYVSYFNVLKEGKQFHSPKNCLIGSGSTPLKTGVVSVPIHHGRDNVKVSYMLLQMGDQKQLILYWFQGRGRVMHSEYEERIYRVLDAVFKRRTEGAFIRISSVDRGDRIKETLEGLVDFSSQIIPILDQHFPVME
jgi:EpsI family protein